MALGLNHWGSYFQEYTLCAKYYLTGKNCSAANPADPLTICCFKYNGFSVGYRGWSFRVWEGPRLKPHPLLLLRNNSSPRYLTTSSHSHLKSYRMAKVETEKERFFCLASFHTAAQSQIALKCFMLLRTRCSFPSKLAGCIWGVWGLYFALGFCSGEKILGQIIKHIVQWIGQDTLAKFYWVIWTDLLKILEKLAALENPQTTFSLPSKN